jgi:hypothetical protein
MDQVPRNPALRWLGRIRLEDGADTPTLDRSAVMSRGSRALLLIHVSKKVCL